jgi:hypothetical protein
MAEEASKQEAPTNSDHQVELNYIDKVSETARKNSAAQSRAIVYMMVVSVFFLAISLEMITLKDTYSLAGLQIDVPQSILLYVGGLLITTLVLSFVALEKRYRRLAARIRELYKNLGYEIDLGYEYAFDGGDAFGAISQKFHEEDKTKLQTLNKLVSLLPALMLLLIIPVATVVTIVLKLALIAGWHRFWVWAPALLFVVAVIGYISEYISDHP